MSNKSQKGLENISICRLLNLLPSVQSINSFPTRGDFCRLQTLRKHAYSNILIILQPKNESFQIKGSDIFHISAQSIDCGYSLEPPRRGGSNGYVFEQK